MCTTTVDTALNEARIQVSRKTLKMRNKQFAKPADCYKGDSPAELGVAQAEEGTTASVKGAHQQSIIRVILLLPAKSSLAQ